MTTPHAPEGEFASLTETAAPPGAVGLVRYSADVKILEGRGPIVEFKPYASGQWLRYGPVMDRIAYLGRCVSAARADGATAERARLAGMASEEDRGMVDALDSICRSGRVTHLEWLEAYTTLLARLAAARGKAVEEAIRWAWANHERFHVDSEDEAVRDALAALFPPPGAEVGRG